MSRVLIYDPVDLVVPNRCIAFRESENTPSYLEPDKVTPKPNCLINPDVIGLESRGVLPVFWKVQGGVVVEMRAAEREAILAWQNPVVEPAHYFHTTRNIGVHGTRDYNFSDKKVFVRLRMFRYGGTTQEPIPKAIKVVGGTDKGEGAFTYRIYDPKKMQVVAELVGKVFAVPEQPEIFELPIAEGFVFPEQECIWEVLVKQEEGSSGEARLYDISIDY